MAVTIEDENFGKTFEKISVKEMGNKEFEQCKFINCEFVGSDFKHSSFIDCEFIDSNLTLIKVHSTKFQDVIFRKSKIAGVNFSNCAKFGLSFEFDTCYLKHCDFSELNLPKLKAEKCQFEGVDFDHVNLKESNFRKSNFIDSSFQNCNLSESGFLGADGYLINPAINNVMKARFDYPGLLGLLRDFGIKFE